MSDGVDEPGSAANPVDNANDARQYASQNGRTPGAILSTPHVIEPARLLSAEEFLSIPRAPIEPFVSTNGGRTVLLAADTTLLVAGPSGHGKSLVAAFDLGGHLAADEGSRWLGLDVCGGLRVLLLPYEGSAEDIADRLHLLIPTDARKRFALLDRFDPHRPVLRAQPDHLQRLAELIGEHLTDVLIIDTASAFFGGTFDIAKGIPEEAYAVIEDLRARSDRRFGCIPIAHTKKADRGGAKVDELEEISGTFPRKVDAAIVLRREGQDGPRRLVRFPKVRRGPEPRSILAAFPDEDSNEPPRLTVLADVGRPLKEGTEAEQMAAWIEQHSQPVTGAELRAKFDISDTTLRDRRQAQLKELGIRVDKLPGRSNTHGYGTAAQWSSLLSPSLGEAS